MIRENCFKNKVSEIYKKKYFCPPNPPKIVNAFMVYLWFMVYLHFFLEVELWTQKKNIFFTNLKPNIWNSFP